MSTNDVAMNALLAKLYRTFTAPDTVNGIASAADQAYFSFLSPGIPVSASTFDFLAMANKQQLDASSAFSQLVNSIPRPTGFWSTGGEFVWNAYEYAINNAIVAPKQLTPQQEQQLTGAFNLLYASRAETDPLTGAQLQVRIPTPLYARYQTSFQTYSTALRDYNSKLIYVNSHPNDGDAVQDWALNGNLYAQTVAAAFGDWQANGKGQVEQAVALISNLTEGGAAVYFQNLKNTLLLAGRRDGFGSKFLQSFYFPDKFWTLDTSWTSFKFDEAEVHEYSSSSSTSWGGGTSGGWGFWSWGASVSHSESQSQSSCETRGLKVRVDLIQVPLVRPWMDALLFKNRSWRLSNPNEQLSNGLAPPATRGTLAIYPTSMIIARNLEVELDMTSTQNSAFASQTTMAGSVGWGPFSLRGNYSKASASSSHDFKSTTSGLACSGMQVLGFVNAVVPLCPDSDPAVLGTLSNANALTNRAPTVNIF